MTVTSTSAQEFTIYDGRKHCLVSTKQTGRLPKEVEGER